VLVGDVTFFKALLVLDRETAEACRAGRCPKCGRALHVGNFERKPRGGPSEKVEGFNTRFSFSCGACRGRQTPASVRFLGRRIYLGVVVALAAVLMQGATPQRCAKIRAAVGADVRTLKRWAVWWRTTFAESPFWRRVSKLLLPPVEVDQLPRGLVQNMVGTTLRERLAACLRLLRPITTGAGLAGAR
jgi:hypothetical protein